MEHLLQSSSVFQLPKQHPIYRSLTEETFPLSNKDDEALVGIIICYLKWQMEIMNQTEVEFYQYSKTNHFRYFYNNSIFSLV